MRLVDSRRVASGIPGSTLALQRLDGRLSWGRIQAHWTQAQALFLSSQIDCAVEQFNDSPDGQIEAHEQLLYAVESYFAQAAVKGDGSSVSKTLLPPIYLQQPGHSITIIGFERRKDGSCNLIVFDPMYHTSPAMHGLIGRKNIRTHRPEVLQAYRRGAKQLGKHASFEALM